MPFNKNGASKQENDAFRRIMILQHPLSADRVDDFRTDDTAGYWSDYTATHMNRNEKAIFNTYGVDLI